MRDWEWLHMDWTRLTVNLGKELSEKYPDHKFVANKDKHSIESVKWEDVDMDEDAYVLRVSPTSMMPTTPAGRKNFLVDLHSRGIFSPEQVVEHLQMPDFDQFFSLHQASKQVIEKAIEGILDDGKYQEPYPWQDLQLTLKHGQMWLNKVMAMEEPPPRENIEMLQQYLAQTQEYMARAEQAQMQQQMAMQAQMAPPPPPPGAAVPQPPGPEGQAPQALTPQDGAVM
jgi:hypothetical protein